MAHFENHGTFTNVYNGTSYGYDNSIYDINTTPQYIPSTGGPNQFLTYKDNGTGLYWADAPKSDASYTLLEIIQDICLD